jgi:hypothetical protein
MNEEEITILVKLYADEGIPLDQLPYTRVFTRIAFKFRKSCPKGFTNQEIWSTLCNLRKDKRLPKMGKPKKPPE